MAGSLPQGHPRVEDRSPQNVSISPGAPPDPWLRTQGWSFSGHKKRGPRCGGPKGGIPSRAARRERDRDRLRYSTQVSRQERRGPRTPASSSRAPGDDYVLQTRTGDRAPRQCEGPFQSDRILANSSAYPSGFAIDCEQGPHW